jgi:hypothetical protein
VDETSRVFFDRTKTNTKQPNLAELFNAAIRDLTYKQTAAFDQFLIYTHLASRDYKRQRHVSTDNSSQNHLLNINPEGELLKEVKDIMDELYIMMRIKEQQQSVMESFVKHIRRVLTPLARSHRPTAPHVLAPWDVVRGATLEPNSPYTDDVAHFREEDQRQSAKRTLTKADMLLQDVDERIAELRALEQNARNTSVAVCLPFTPTSNHHIHTQAHTDTHTHTYTHTKENTDTHPSSKTSSRSNNNKPA